MQQLQEKPQIGFVETLSGRTNHLRIIHISRRTRRTTSPLGRSLRSRRLRAAKSRRGAVNTHPDFAFFAASHLTVLELRPFSPSFFSPDGAHAPDVPSVALHTFGVRTPFPSGKSSFAPYDAHAPAILAVALHTFGVRTPFPSGKSHFA